MPPRPRFKIWDCGVANGAAGSHPCGAAFFQVIEIAFHLCLDLRVEQATNSPQILPRIVARNATATVSKVGCSISHAPRAELLNDFSVARNLRQASY